MAIGGTCRWGQIAVVLAFGVTAAILTAESSSTKQAGGYGPHGPQGPRMREQLWILPSGDPRVQVRATVFRPSADARMPLRGATSSASARRPMIVINHGTSEATRQAVAMPIYYWLSRWFVDRGYVVVLPQRRGHGATGGNLIEATDTCIDPDHFASGQLAAQDIEAAISYMSKQSFVVPGKTIVVGVSSGGWASLAVAARNLVPVRAVVSFAGGRGGHAWGQRNAVCGEERLIESSGRYGTTARAPTLWLYADNDSYFGPDLARSMSNAWSRAGGLAEIHILPAYGTDGHNLADDQAGWQLWGDAVESFLRDIEVDTQAKRTAANCDAGATRELLATWETRCR